MDNRMPRFESLRRRFLIAGVVGTVACVVGVFFNSAQFYQSYLIAYLLWLGIALGCLPLLMLHHLVGGVWGFVIRRIVEAGIRTLPLMALLFLPIANKLKALVTRHARFKEMVIDGLEAIANGENPRNIEMRLEGYLA